MKENIKFVGLVILANIITIALYLTFLNTVYFRFIEPINGH